MRVQVLNLGGVEVRYRLGDTWFDGALELSAPLDPGAPVVHIEGTDAVVALRDFLNSLDFAGRKLSVVSRG